MRELNPLAESIVEPALRPEAAAIWEEATRWISGLPQGGVNIAYEAVDRHLADPEVASRVAIRWLGKKGASRDLTYAQLAALSNQFANVLQTLGLQAGERVYTLAGRTPLLYVAVLGALKLQAVVCPLFSAFGPEPIASRMEIGNARAVVTSARLYRRKISKLRERLPHLDTILVMDGEPGDAIFEDEGVHHLPSLLEAASTEWTIEATDPETLALLHFTSGTTGKPKGAMHVHKAVIAHHWTGRHALDLHAGDVFWCTADPGWVTGMSYGIIAPLTHGVTCIVDEADFSADRWYSILAEQKVDIWYTAPTAIRMLMKAGDTLPTKYDLSHVRFVASVGEPLNPEAVRWGKSVLDLTIHDNWWQTETGGIMIANQPGMAVKPGSMGKPLPGIEAGIVRRDGVLMLDSETAGEEGELALRPGWPSMMRGYLNQEVRYQKCFADGWYLSGDIAKCDEEGYYWFVGRADDVINTAGHLVSPFEVESVLMEHEAVAEAGVIGKPDEVAMEVVKAFVALHDGVEATDALRKELQALTRTRLGAAVAPREIDFHDELPKTRSGKIMRRLLKARELGLPEGDTSTLLTASVDD